MARSKQKAPATALPASHGGVITMPAKPDPNVLYVREAPGKSRGQLLAEDMVSGDSWNGLTAVNFSRGSFGKELPLTESIEALRSATAKIQSGDLSQVEAMLFGQATALATIFHECARRASINMGGYPDAMERYMRLGLKAQSQCRTTLEALVEAKHPKSVAFVRQANIANGHQQVNNGEAPAGRAETFQNEPNELQPALGRSLDAGASAQGSRLDTRSPTLVEIDRAKDRRGEG